MPARGEIESRSAPRADQRSDDAMNRPSIVREIYAELRHVADPDLTAGELLRAAASIADAYESATAEHDPGLTYHTGGVSFDRWPLDRAMADGGWRILRYERELAQPDFDDQSSSEAIAINGWMMENVA